MRNIINEGKMTSYPTPIQLRIENAATSGLGYYIDLPQWTSGNKEIDMQLKLGAMDAYEGKIDADEYKEFSLISGMTMARLMKLNIYCDKIKNADDLKLAMDETRYILNPSAN